MARPAKVLIVDDSAIVRHLLSTGLAGDPNIQVVGQAADAFIARDLLLKHEPDVITLDVEMTDQFIDPLAEAVDILVRIAELKDSAS